LAWPIVLLLVFVTPVAAFYTAILGPCVALRCPWGVGFPTLFTLVGPWLATAIPFVLLLVALHAIIPVIWHWGTPRMRSL
jgi:hypothetical protein